MISASATVMQGDERPIGRQADAMVAMYFSCFKSAGTAEWRHARAIACKRDVVLYAALDKYAGRPVPHATVAPEITR